MPSRFEMAVVPTTAVAPIVATVPVVSPVHVAVVIPTQAQLAVLGVDREICGLRSRNRCRDFRDRYQ